MTGIIKSLSNRNAFIRLALLLPCSPLVSPLQLHCSLPGFGRGQTAIKVGITSGEGEDVWRVVKTEADKQGARD